MNPTISQKPSVGRVVHYHPAPGTEPQVGLVIKVYSDTTVKLQVCNEFGTWSTHDSVPLYAEGGAGAHWNWPPRG